jgi:hypothetical protein
MTCSSSGSCILQSGGNPCKTMTDCLASQSCQNNMCFSSGGSNGTAPPAPKPSVDPFKFYPSCKTDNDCFLLSKSSRCKFGLTSIPSEGKCLVACRSDQECFSFSQSLNYPPNFFVCLNSLCSLGSNSTMVTPTAPPSDSNITIAFYEYPHFVVGSFKLASDNTIDYQYRGNQMIWNGLNSSRSFGANLTTIINRVPSGTFKFTILRAEGPSAADLKFISCPNDTTTQCNSGFMTFSVDFPGSIVTIMYNLMSIKVTVVAPYVAPKCDAFLCGVNGICIEREGCKCYDGWTGEKCDTQRVSYRLGLFGPMFLNANQSYNNVLKLTVFDNMDNSVYAAIQQVNFSASLPAGFFYDPLSLSINGKSNSPFWR